MPTLKGTAVSLLCVKYFLYLVSSSINISIFHSKWLDTFSTDLVCKGLFLDSQFCFIHWSSCLLVSVLHCFLRFIFQREQERGERERERGEKHSSVASLMPPTGDLACNPGMCPDWELNLKPFG